MVWISYGKHSAPHWIDPERILAESSATRGDAGEGEAMRLYSIHGLANPPKPDILFESYTDHPDLGRVCLAVRAGSQAFLDGFGMLCPETADDFRRIVSLSRDVTDGSLLIHYRCEEYLEWMKAAPIVLRKVDAPEWWKISRAGAQQRALLILARVLGQAGFHPDKKHRLWTALLKTAELEVGATLAAELKRSVPGRLITQFLQAAARDQGGRVADGPTKAGELQPLEPTERRETS